MATPSPDSTVATVAVQIEEQLPEELLNETFVKNAKPVTALIGPLDESFDATELVEILTMGDKNCLTIEKDVENPMETNPLWNPILEAAIKWWKENFQSRMNPNLPKNVTIVTSLLEILNRYFLVTQFFKPL